MATELIMIHDEVSDRIIESVGKLARENQNEKITVRDVLKDLGITNRVFYNRFHNIDEVYRILYLDMIHKVRESVAIPWDDDTDFITHVKQVAEQTLIISYACKESLAQFVFETDSSNDENFRWWTGEIRKLILLGQSKGFIRRDLDVEIMCYSIWCFIRGFNADAIARNLTLEEAKKVFDIGFGTFLESLRVTN